MPLAEQASSEALAPIPNTPLLSEIFPPNLHKWPSQIIFKGWKQPQQQWKQWVDRLAPKYSTIWTQIGIHEAIMTSTYEFKRNPELVLALSQFWCPATNTFAFPWGEATVTLLDVTVLTGLPVVGDSVTSQLSGDSVVAPIVEELEKQRIKLNKSKSKKASHGMWIKSFMEEETEHEHAGFLALWLSRFVFPSLPNETVQKNLFPIAAKLSVGKPVALGISLLASIYRDLTAIYKETMCRKESITVVAPFQLLQMWVLEHFPVILRGYRVEIYPGEPRVARWNKLEVDLPFVESVLRVVRKILEDGDQFVWQPYKERLENKLNEDEQMLLFGLQSFELVGMDCNKEEYSPQRVAMQLGMDQGSFSERYTKWWKEMMIARQGVKLEGRYAKFSEDLKKLCSDEHLYYSDSSLSSSKSCDESDDDLIPIATRFKIRHGFSPYKESTSNVNVEDFTSDNSERTLDVPAAERILLDKGVPEGKNDIVIEVSEDISERSESTRAAKKKKNKVEGSTSKPVNLDNEVHEVAAENMGGDVQESSVTRNVELVEESASKSVDLGNGIDARTDKMNKRVLEVPADVEVNLGEGTRGKNDITKEVMKKVLVEDICEGSESAQAAKNKKVVESASKPIDLDNGKDVGTWDYRKAAQELEEKMDYLEKLLSQVPDI